MNMAMEMSTAIQVVPYKALHLLLMGVIMGQCISLYSLLCQNCLLSQVTSHVSLVTLQYHLVKRVLSVLNTHLSHCCWLCSCF